MASTAQFHKKTPINFMQVWCLLSFCFRASMTGANTNMRHAPIPPRPPTGRHAHPLMHKHSNTVLKWPLHIEAPCLNSLAIIRTVPFSTDGDARSLVTCHTPGCPEPDRAVTLPRTDQRAMERCGSCQRRCVAHSDPSLCQIA